MTAAQFTPYYNLSIKAAFMLVALFALLALNYEDVGYKCLQLASVIGWLDLIIGRRRVVNSWPFYLLWAALALQLISWGLSVLQVPQFAESSPKLHRLGVWFQFLPVAWIIAGSRHRIATLFTCAAIGLCLTPWLSGAGWQELQHGLNGQRVDFGLSNAQHTSLYFACGLLAVLTVGSYLHSGHGWRRALGWLLRLLLAGAFLLGVAVTQTRGIWLGLVVAIGGLCLLLMVNYRTTMKHGKLAHWLVLLSAAILMVVAFSESRFASRLNTNIELITNTSITTPRLQHSQDESAAIRISLWRSGWQWFEQRPLLGWGGAGRKHAAEAAELPEQWSSIQHLHSSYLDTLVCFGAVGLMIFLLWMAWFTWTFAKAARHKTLATPWCGLAIAWLLLMAIANLFESYQYFSSGLYTITLLGGALTSVVWREQGVFARA